MSKNGGSGCDGCPYLVMSQTVSAREHGITTLRGEAASLLSFLLSPADPIQPPVFIFIFMCHLALSLKFIYALFLLSVFVLSVSFFFLFFYLPPTSSPLDKHQFSFSLYPFQWGVFRIDSCPSGVQSVSTAMLTAIGECFIKQDLSLKQRYSRMSSSQLHQ